MNYFIKKNLHRIFGTFPLRGDAAVAAVTNAIDVGYRHIDTAQTYANEADVGDAIANSGMPRDELFITTKVPPGNFTQELFMPSVEQSLKDLRIDSADLLLVHWPPANDEDITPSLRLLAQAHTKGLAKCIGVSNYTSAMLRTAQTAIDVPISVNQVEFHPLLNQNIMLATSAETGIPLSAYCSMARGKVLEHALFAEIGAKHDKAANQVVLRWIVQKDVAPITMSSKRDNMTSNFAIADFELSADEMASIDTLTTTGYRVVNKGRCTDELKWD